MERQQRANRAVRGSLHKSRGAKHRAEPRRIELDRWLLAGAIALGLGAAMAGGSGLAHADTSDAGGSTSSGDHKRHISGSAGSAVATSSMQGSASSTAPTRSTPNVRTSADSDMTTAVSDATTIAARTAVPTSIGPTRPLAHPRSAAANPASSPRAVTGSPANPQAAALPTATQHTTLMSTASRSSCRPWWPHHRSPQQCQPSRGHTGQTASRHEDRGEVAVPINSHGGPCVAGQQHRTRIAGRAIGGAGGAGPHRARPASGSFHYDSGLHPAQTGVGLISRPIGAVSLSALNPAAATSDQAAVRATGAPINEASTAGSATVPLRVESGTEPVIDISVNGGPTEPVLVDTGSDGLVIGLRDIGLRHLGWPTGFGMSGYSGGLTYIYATFNTTVKFGNGIVTGPTSVDVRHPVISGIFHPLCGFRRCSRCLGYRAERGGPGPQQCNRGVARRSQRRRAHR